MCGIAGIWDRTSSSKDNLLSQVKEMARIMQNRGPDSSGSWIDADNGLAFSHSRLSILDLSDTGNQPMISKSNRYVLVFNGEIYNHKYLREILEKKSNFKRYWKGSSDTETLLSMIEVFGIKSTLDKIVGMFAFAVWDIEQKKLTLVKDRFGEKPLYWGWDNLNERNSFIFASDISAFKAIVKSKFSINRDSLGAYFERGYIPAPMSIFNEINQLLPGHLLEINFKNKKQTDIKSYQWWNPIDEVNAERFIFGSEDEAISILEQELKNTIYEQSISDVSLGVFLSGGIDSTLITSLLQSQNNNPITTFTISFPEFCKNSKGFNEGTYAKEIANFLGTNHCEVELSSKETKEIITQLPKIYTEPFADSSQIPSHLVCREAKNYGIKVAMSGDGGDELFGGYNRYLFSPKLQNIFSKLPSNFRHFAADLILSMPSLLGSLSEEKKEKICLVLRNSDSLDSVYDVLTKYWINPQKILIKNALSNTKFSNEISPLKYAPSPEEKLMLADLISYLPNDILVKMDRASMATGFETRAPYLDNRIAKIAWNMPINMKIKDSYGKKIGKWPLRVILSKYMPKKLFNRPKAGFAVPIGNWLIHDKNLNNWAQDLIGESLIKKQGFLDPNSVRETWDNHVNGRVTSHSKIWTILMWQAWFEEWIK